MKVELCIGRSVLILVIFSQCLGNNEESAIDKFYGIMRSVHSVNLPGDCIMKLEIFVHWQVCEVSHF